MSNTPLRWTHDAGQSLAMVWGGKQLLRYAFGRDVLKPHVHPLVTTGGVPLTVCEPWDHVWHRGVWFAWKYIDGINFWEESAAGEDEGDGLTCPDGGERVDLSESSATVTTHLVYGRRDHDPVLREDRQVTFHAPYADGTYAIDWHMTFRPGGLESVTLDRTPVNAQTPWGGYAGFSWRLARSLGGPAGAFKALNSEGATDADCEHASARWLDLSARADGARDGWGGLTMFDHPANPRHPTRWRCIMDPGFGYVNAALLLTQPLALPVDPYLRLKYRTLVHDQIMTVHRIEQEYKSFSGG